MSQHRTLCRNKDSISVLSLAWTLLRHIVAGCNIVLLGCLKLCRDIQKLCRDIDCCIFHFLLLFCFFSLIFQLTPAKHKVSEYSIIWHENRSKTVTNMPKNGLKIDEFKTHH